MAKEKRQTREELGVKDGDQLIVSGIVTFSEVAQAVDGERLQRKIQREKDRGVVYPVDKPHRSITIEDIEIDEEYRGTPLATFYGQEAYKNKDDKYALSLVSKSPFAPEFLHMQDNGKVEKIDELPAELAKGQKVQILIKAFTTKKFSNLSSAFEAFLLPAGKIEYYENTASNALNAFGVEMEHDEKETDTVDVNPEENPFGGAPSTPETDSVPEDAKPEEPETTQSNVDNPFA